MNTTTNKRQYNKLNRLTEEEKHERSKASMRRNYYKNKEERLKYSKEYHEREYKNNENYRNYKLIHSYKKVYNLTDDEINNICNNDYKKIQRYIALKKVLPENDTIKYLNLFTEAGQLNLFKADELFSKSQVIQSF